MGEAREVGKVTLGPQWRRDMAKAKNLSWARHSDAPLAGISLARWDTSKTCANWFTPVIYNAGRASDFSCHLI